jgi:hypothetical protein
VLLNVLLSVYCFVNHCLSFCHFSSWPLDFLSFDFLNLIAHCIVFMLLILRMNKLYFQLSTEKIPEFEIARLDCILHIYCITYLE